ncbi:hypothetical protein [Solimonas sp. K1W22B-7]|uniref:hypothetical protein n=1 Tax=Solimonas sp. K1W22B-7 TaxID=2303331 RepID=UPI0013C4FC19|nr:hypothetical protein [Solimonas sp. K1W22B-7]
MSVLRAACCAAVFLLAGCETYYRVPDREPTARVRFKATAPEQPVLVTAYSSPQCDKDPPSGLMGVLGGINNDPLGRVPPQVRESGNTLGMVGYEAGPATQPIERLIPADRKFVFAIFRVQVMSAAVKSCWLSMMFDPQPGAQYEVEYAETDQACGIGIYRLQRGPGQIVSRSPEPSAQRTPEACPGTF